MGARKCKACVGMSLLRHRSDDGGCEHLPAACRASQAIASRHALLAPHRQPQAFFNVQTSPDGSPVTQGVTVSQERVDEFIRTGPPPSAECCRVVCQFNADLCSCDAAVLNFAVQLAGNDPNVYASSNDQLHTCMYASLHMLRMHPLVCLG